MSKIEAYRCDHCRNLKSADEIVGVSAQSDMFNKLKSYPIIYHPERAEIHLCVECYNNKAAIPAQNEVDRRKDEEGYKKKLEEFSYGVRAQCVHNYNTERLSEKNRRKVAHVK